MGLQYRKTSQVLRFKEDKPTVYKIAQVTMPCITYGELVNECSVSCGVNTSMVKASVDALLNRLVHYASIGHPVSLGEFGSFKVDIRVKTVADIADADASTIKQKIIRFYPGKDLRDMLANLNVEAVSEATPPTDSSNKA